MVWIATTIFDENRRPEIDSVPNQNFSTYDIETTNPSSVAYRVTAARFTIYQRVPPPLPIGSIDNQIVYFTPDDYDPETDSYYKVLHDAEMNAKGNLNFRFYIRDPKYHDYTFHGRLTLYYGDRSAPQELSKEHTIFVD